MRITQIDAFTDKAFTGNPAAVCLLQEFPDDLQMQLLAREMNLSETAFLQPADQGFRLRWFTPATEVDLCGHATLAAAHFLWESEHLAGAAEARFWTRSGRLTAVRRDTWIEMDFPAQPAAVAEPPEGLVAAAGARPVFVGRNEVDWLLEVQSEKEVLELEPDLGCLSRLCERGLIVTARSASPDRDFISRFFAPAVGVDEDPVTGSAHCCLAPYWADRLGIDEVIGFQASSRGGSVSARLVGDRVLLAGQAVTVMRGELTVPWPQVE